MKTSLKLALLASSIVGLSLAIAPGALARYHGYDDRDRAISSSPETGGYCDSSGCPDHFWRYPIHYGPVFVHGQWYRGPAYFRGDRYAKEYWVRGGWHRDEWRGHRPGWAQQSHDGPPLAFEYYANHGFQVGDHWRHEHDADTGGDHGWNGGDHHDGGGDQGWNGRDHHDNGGDHGGYWNGTDNGADQGRGDNRGPSNGGDWRTGGTNPPTYDQNRTPDNNGGRNTGGPLDPRSGYGSGGPPPSQMSNNIHVTTATYGATCHVPAGNVTKFVGDACNGKGMCEYVVQYQAIGDPAPGCAKDFSVQWTCSSGPGGTAAAPAEAGLGSKVSLRCANTGH